MQPKPVLWLVLNPITLPAIFIQRKDGVVEAEFPALPGCVAEGNSLDEAVFALAKAMQAYLEPRLRGNHGDDPKYIT